MRRNSSSFPRRTRRCCSTSCGVTRRCLCMATRWRRHGGCTPRCWRGRRPRTCIRLARGARRKRRRSCRSASRATGASGHARVERRVPRPELVPELLPFPDAAALSRAAAELVAEIAETAVTERGRFTMALAGGHTPESLYRMLAGEYSDRMPWASTHLYFGDERCVPPTDPDSNYRMANAALIAQVPGLAARAHRIEGERGPTEAAARYDALLRGTFVDPAATFDL